MKIAIVSNNAPSNSVSGYKLATTQLIEELTKKRQDILVVGVDRKEHITKNSNLSTFLFPGRDGKRGYLTPIWSTKNIAHLYNTFDEFRPDVMHIQDPMSLGTLAYVWAVRNNVPIVYTAHSRPSKVARFAFPSELIANMVDATVLNHFLRELIHGVDRVIVWNEEVKNDVLSIAPKARIKIFNNAIHVKKFRTDQKRKFEKPFKFSFVGMYNPKKNQKFLVEIFSHLSDDFELFLYGPTERSPDYTREIQEYVEKHNLRNVHISGTVDPQEVPNLLAQSNFFISASKLETHSLVVTEALASGTPVICYGAKFINPLVDETVGFDIDRSLSSVEVAEEIKSFVSHLDSDSYTKLSISAQKKVQGYDWSIVVEEYIELYKRVLAESSSLSHSRIDELINLITLKPFRKEIMKALGIESSEDERKKKRVGVLTILFLFGSFIASIYLILISFGRRQKKNKVKE